MTAFYNYFYLGLIFYLAVTLLLWTGPSRRIFWWLEDLYLNEYGTSFPLLGPVEMYEGIISLLWIVLLPALGYLRLQLMIDARRRGLTGE